MISSVHVLGDHSAHLKNPEYNAAQLPLTGEEVKLANFGNFEIKEKRARPGRNPKNGQPFEISARRVVTFHASPKLKQESNRELV